MDSRHRDLRLLEAIEQDQQITQRNLARKLDIALGLANVYLKRMIRKGYIKCVSVPSNRLLYLITPKGIAEKTRLSYEFMEYSLYLYRDARRQLHTALEPVARDGRKRVAIYGSGEAAELAYLSLKEYGLEPVAILGSVDGREFLGFHIHDVRTYPHANYDLVIVATLEPPALAVDELVNLGVPRDRLVTLRSEIRRPRAAAQEQGR